VARPGSSEQVVGSAAKQDGNLAAHNVWLHCNNVRGLLSAVFFTTVCSIGQSPEVNLTEKPRFTVLEPHMARC
jgi:hypothetical protein